MNTISIYQLLVISLVLGACQFNHSVSTDIKTGAYATGNGIGCDTVTIKVNGKEENRNEFVFGESVDLVFKNITGFKKFKNKKFPEISMFVVKNEKDTVLREINLLQKLKKGTEFSPLDLNTKFKAVFAHNSNEIYKAHVRIWDRKSEGQFNYELPFTIKPSDLLTINTKGIGYSNIYLWNETKKETVLESKLSVKESYTLILEGIEGLKAINNKAFPIFSIELTDRLGNMIITNPNLLSAYEKTGVDPEDLKIQLTSKISFSAGKINNPCTLKVNVADQNSDKKIAVVTQLNIE